MPVPVTCDGSVDPTNATDKANVQSAVVEGRTLELRQGKVNGVQVAWTRLTNAHAGDTIWLEISGDSGNTWIQCNRLTIQSGGRNFTNAQPTNASSEVCMRAVTQLAGPRYQTANWC